MQLPSYDAKPVTAPPLQINPRPAAARTSSSASQAIPASQHVPAASSLPRDGRLGSNSSAGSTGSAVSAVSSKPQLRAAGCVECLPCAELTVHRGSPATPTDPSRSFSDLAVCVAAHVLPCHSSQISKKSAPRLYDVVPEEDQESHHYLPMTKPQVRWSQRVQCMYSNYTDAGRPPLSAHGLDAPGP